MSSNNECYACNLTAGRETLVGGCVFETDAWVVEHCMGPLGVGTLIVKPKRHILHVWELDSRELSEMGPLLGRAARVVRELTGCDQAYVCLWSHGEFKPVHVHFVVQPVSNALRAEYEHAGPALQTEMFRRSQPLDAGLVVRFCDDARRCFEAGA